MSTSELARPEISETCSIASLFGRPGLTMTSSGPVSDLLTVGRWCQAGRPSTRGVGRRLECEMGDRQVTVFEVLPPRPNWPGRQTWQRDAIARLRYDADSSTWTLHWPSGRQYRRDPEVPATADIRTLLALVDGDAIAA